MTDKKGFMLGEYTLKAIIAVLCLLLLFYLLFTLYSDSKKNKELDKAKGVLDALGQTMSVAKTSGNVQDFTVLGFEGWALISYIKGEYRPIACEDSCICLCSRGLAIRYWDEDGKKQAESCNKKGVCKNFQDSIKKFGWGYYLNEASNPKPSGNPGATIIGDLKVEYKNNQFEITKVAK